MRTMNTGSEVVILFSARMAQSTIDGDKIATTRRSRKGEPGDRFEGWGRWFHLIDVVPGALAEVRDRFWRLEGCESPHDFEQVWRRLHGGEWIEDGPHFTHFYTRVK